MSELSKELVLKITEQEGPKVETQFQSGQENVTNKTNQQKPISWQKKYKSWILMAIYSIFLVAGQSAAILLGRLYFDKGGNSNWMATFVQLAGFPFMFPLYFIFSPKKNPNPNPNLKSNTLDPKPKSSPSRLVLASMYSGFGVFLAIDCLLYSLGQKYLPASTYSLICASQLAFTAFFSFFFNSLKFTSFIINSLVLLTISSTLLVFQPDDSSNSTHIPKSKYPFGFICTIAASAGYGLMLSLTQFAFKKIIKQENFKVVLDMIVYPSIVATLVVLVGLFASGEWKTLNQEMDGFELGKVSYLMTLIWTAISWQVYSIGCTGLIFQVSSLFSIVIDTVGLPIVPVIAVFTFGDSMGGVKVISLILAIWGFVSYVYQHYLDDFKNRIVTANCSTSNDPKIPNEDFVVKIEDLMEMEKQKY